MEHIVDGMIHPYQFSDDVLIRDSWSTIDKWWTPHTEEWFYVRVFFMGRGLVFRRSTEDPVWRICPQ